MRYGLSLEDEATRLQRHGRWGALVVGGRCRGHRGTGYCERTGALTTRSCGVRHRGPHGWQVGGCPVQRTYCLDHGPTLWVSRP